MNAYYKGKKKCRYASLKAMRMKIRELKLFVLLLGFLGGNLFGTLLGYLRGFLVWDGLIIATLLALSETISYISYRPSRSLYNARKTKGLVIPAIQGLENSLRDAINDLYKNENRHRVWRSCFNFFKIGVMIGFFVDAFKVGS